MFAINKSFVRRMAAVAAALVVAVQPFTSASPANAEADEVWRVLDLTNAERAAAGIEPLSMNPALVGAAQPYAEVLATSDCFAHTCGPQPDMAQRAVDAGYGNWSTLGENLAGGQRSPEEVVAAWMASPGHRANILNPAFSEIGIGMSYGGQYGVYWTQSFGASF